MDQLGSAPNATLVASLLLLLSMLWLRVRSGRSQAPRKRTHDQLDTVQAWPAKLVRVLTPVQLKAHDLLRQALPGQMILSQTPLAQFMRVSTRYSYSEWFKRAGRLRASFLVCDAQATVIAAVDLRLANESEREQARHVRLVRVLDSVGVPVLVWGEHDLPTVSQIRQRFAGLLEDLAQRAAAALPQELAAGDEMMSGLHEAMDAASTDFAAFETAPVPFDEGRRPARGSA